MNSSKRDSDEYDMEMIPETKLENFDLTDFEIHSNILKRTNSNIFCLRSKNNNNMVEPQRKYFSNTVRFVGRATRFIGANLKNICRTSFESDQPLIETPTESRKGFSESYL